ncbi:MAG: methylated-DNA--[protein]-cysteine S-methyltransferase [Firmicutes bacterium]|nr:methylated-DNA--[protein]-cysteine S-methyltransferase [Bacillota bacterium]
MNYKSLQTPIGVLTVESDGEFVTRILFNEDIPNNGECAILELTAKQLQEYFAGQRRVFDVPLRLEGGEFVKRVWRIMIDEVGFGTIVTYGELAKRAGNPKASRAVGMANNRNPIPIIIPCHRVMGKNGKLTGFRWGLNVKQWLLSLERSL